MHENNFEKLMILDGGIATELSNKGFTLSKALWSAHLLVENPKAIKDVHLDYLEKGHCDICTTCSYQVLLNCLWCMTIKKVSFEGFQREKNCSVENVKVEDVLRDAVVVAKSAVQNIVGHKFVAASVSSFGASISDITGEAKEYFGDYLDDDVDTNESHYVHEAVKELSQDLFTILKTSGIEEMVYRFHLPRVRELMKAEPDFLLLETMPVLREVKILCDRVIPDVLKEIPNNKTMILISFQCKDGSHTGHGELISDCVSYVNQMAIKDMVLGMGVNCVAPSITPSLIDIIHSELDASKYIIVYPNSGEIWDSVNQVWQPPKSNQDWDYLKDFVPFMKKWHDDHPDRGLIIGGCCRTNPNHIHNLSSALKSQ